MRTYIEMQLYIKYFDGVTTRQKVWFTFTLQIVMVVVNSIDGYKPYESYCDQKRKQQICYFLYLKVYSAIQ